MKNNLEKNLERFLKVIEKVNRLFKQLETELKLIKKNNERNRISCKLDNKKN
jgi:hypothetical protein